MMGQMEKLLAEGGLNARETAYLHYALGKAHDDLREYEPAMRHFDGANGAARAIHFAEGAFDLERLRRETDSVIRALGGEEIRRLSEAGCRTRRPILIVGMIRSGTSLRYRSS